MTQEKYSGEFPELKNIIAMEAIRCCHPYGTKASKCSYPNGKKTTEYANALKKAFPKGISGRTAAAKAGAACDVFVSVVMRACGFDKAFPSGLYRDTTYLRNSQKFKKVDVTSYKDLKDGDVIHWVNKTTSGHVCVAVWMNGNCYQANAHARSKRYGILDAKNKTYKPSLYKSFGVFRPINPAMSCLRKGDYGNEVTKLQKFLKWAGFDCGTVDGDFGDKTVNAVKAFQTKVGLTVDGEFGSKSLAKAKEYTIEVQPTKKPYSGTFPKLPARRYFKRGDKGVQVKYLQQFLNWYGKYGLVEDGVIGSKTIVAVEKFQKSEKLGVDGLFGKKCLAKAKQVKI